MPQTLRRAGRTVANTAVVLVLACLLTGCRSQFDGLRLTIATGGTQGVYYVLGGALADAWAEQLSIPHPKVITTAGSVANIGMLQRGQADVGFSAADAASDIYTASGPGSAVGASSTRPTTQPAVRRLRTLARMYDDYLQVMVRANAPVRTVGDLRGLRVSVGSPDSGVQVIAQRVLTTAGLSVSTDLHAVQLGINDSANALREGRIDAFFWSGGLPTRGVAELAKVVPLRMIDLTDVLPILRLRFPGYGSATVPASVYALPTPVTTLVVRNFLLVTETMPDNVAEALVRGLFDAQAQLVRVNSAARSIDARSAIETAPVPLHAGALNYYRSVKV